ncbi:2-hydroxyacid dehydrogenase [Xanthovirga aplysinae]|uniref:2-hydroxyacid dehydrogenase n=1 Tax=Xanthovirga aplysinae TaxID=2529853 RepID=UPI0012BD8096|nr:2-hydroxyacid dehydrogenase [Xanthovirga aplysinae]MTI33050.1 2-hydroxyacid dehydrogenase [Xanthovirga aplysinae]
MKVVVYSVHNFERDFLLRANTEKHNLILLEERLNKTTTSLGKGCKAICIFTGDKANAAVLESLHQLGVNHLALRSASFNHIDLTKVRKLKMKVVRVPAYSPYAIAKHTVALILALNRKLIRAHHGERDLNFSLDGLVGFDVNGKTVGIIGTGKIGSVLARILHGFGCKILAYDKEKNKKLIQQYNVKYTDCESLFKHSDIITLHIPLAESTRYIINEHAIEMMKPVVMLINTSRGGLVKTKAVINALKTKQIGAFGLDVYEEEEGLFFEEHSEDILMDDTIARLMTFKNVLITSHQAFLTETALRNIAETTIYNLDCFENGIDNENEIEL